MYGDLTASDVPSQLAELLLEVILQVKVLNSLVTACPLFNISVTSRRGISNTDSLRITQVINHQTGFEIY